LKLSLEQLKDKFRNVKLIVSDIDGTLLDNNGEIGESTTQMINALSNRGILFSFATQRVFPSIVPFAKKLNIKTPLICMNGALICDADGNTIYKAAINEKKVKLAVDLANKYYVRAALCRTNEIIYTEENSVIRDFLARRGAEYKLVDSYDNYLDDVLEIIISGDNKVLIKKIQSKLNFPFSMHVDAKYYRSSSMMHVAHLEINRSHVNKKLGLKMLTKHLGIKKNEVVVMGDWYNDRHLFDFGGINIALENAVPELKHKANYITHLSNDDDGVGEFLRLIYPDAA
jgi:hypothetical protein